jgi:hypothetical protein
MSLKEEFNEEITYPTEEFGYALRLHDPGHAQEGKGNKPEP